MVRRIGRDSGRDENTKFDDLDRRILQALELSSKPQSIHKLRQDFTLSQIEIETRLAKLKTLDLITQPQKDYFQAAEPASGVMVVRVTNTGRKVLADGTIGHVVNRPRAVPVNWREDRPLPTILLPKNVKRLEVGERLLVRTVTAHSKDGDQIDAKVLKRLGFEEKATLVGKFRMASSGVATKSKVEIAFNGKRQQFKVSGVNNNQRLTNGMTVAVEIDESEQQFRPRVIINELLWASDDDPKPSGQLTRLELGLKAYPPKIEKKMRRAAKKPSSTPRTDLRHLPFMTIDGAYAKDFDDAIAVVPDDAPDNKDGLVAYVAIADVAHFVKAHSEVDKEARKRGFSVYFPDQAVHMLPTSLAEDICSLVPNQDRYALTLKIPYRADGSIIYERCEPLRAIIKSKARLTYEQADSALANITPLDDAELQDALLRAGDLYYSIHGRKTASPRLDLIDEKIVAKFSGQKIVGFDRLQRNTAAALIEDMMVDSGHVAAKLLQAKDAPVISRLHESPSNQQLQEMSDRLRRIGFPVPPEGLWTAGQITEVLAAREEEHMQFQGQMAVLTSLSAAQYSANRHGHFGLQLDEYAQFTSPIRRYADLLVHRALIEAYNLGDERLDMPHSQLNQVCDQLNDLEAQAKSMTANCWKRYEMAYLSRDVGKEIPVFIMKIGRDKMHLRLNGSPFTRSYDTEIFRANGYAVDVAKQLLVRKEDQARFHAGDVVDVRLDSAAPVVNAVSFTPLSHDGANKTAHPPRYGRTSFVKLRSTPVKRSRMEGEIISATTKRITLRIGDAGQLHEFDSATFLGGSVQQRGDALYSFNRRMSYRTGDIVPLIAETWRDMALSKDTNKYVWNVKTRYTLAQGPASRAIPAADSKAATNGTELPEVKLHPAFAKALNGGQDQMSAVLKQKPGLVAIDTPLGHMTVQLATSDINLPKGESLTSFWQAGKRVVITQAAPIDGQETARLDFVDAASLRKSFKPANDGAASLAQNNPSFGKDYA